MRKTTSHLALREGTSLEDGRARGHYQGLAKRKEQRNRFSEKQRPIYCTDIVGNSEKSKRMDSISQICKRRTEDLLPDVFLDNVPNSARTL